MSIDSLSGTAEYQQSEEYKEKISEMILSSAENEIHIYAAERDEDMDEDEPAMRSILLKDGQAVIYYFAEGNEELFASILSIEKDGNLEWHIGSESYSVAEYQLISLEKVLECALQFFASQGKPDCIEWEKL